MSMRVQCAARPGRDTYKYQLSYETDRCGTGSSVQLYILDVVDPTFSHSVS